MEDLKEFMTACMRFAEQRSGWTLVMVGEGDNVTMMGVVHPKAEDAVVAALNDAGMDASLFEKGSTQ